MVDSGVTHNFIDEKFVAQKNIPTIGFDGFSVTNGNGKLTWCKRMVEGLKLRLENYTLEYNFYVLSLGDTHTMVLGVQWLYTLGDIHFKYQKLKTRFQVNNHKIILKGIKDFHS